MSQGLQTRGRLLSYEREFLSAQRNDVVRQRQANALAAAARAAAAKRSARHAFQVRFIWFAIGIAFGAAASCTARAADLGIVAHGISYHSERVRSDGQPYNERNRGLGVRAEFSPAWAAQAGRYENSWSGLDGRKLYSTYIAADYTPLAFAGARVGGFAGLADGYPAWNFKAIPAAGLLARWSVSGHGLTVRLLPTKHAGAVFSAELSVRVWSL